MRQIDLILFGGSGDLATRKLLPALTYILQDTDLLAESRLLIAARNIEDEHDFLQHLRSTLQGFLPDHAGDGLDRLLNRIELLSLDLKQEVGWRALADWLAPTETRDIIYYFAVPSFLFAPLCRKIRAYQLNPPHSRVVVEKPLGEDLKSAWEINDVIEETFAEPQIFRIDHYLGKASLQNIIPLRRENPALEALWNKDHIDNIQITIAETVGVEGRVEFLDRIGTLRDMVQNHMMQIMALLTMDLPEEMSAKSLRQEKIAVTRKLRPITAETIQDNLVIGQYRAGEINGQPVAGYAEEIGAAGGRGEMFIALRAFIDSTRWSGVPIYLRTGKRLQSRIAEIIVTFKPLAGTSPADPQFRRLFIQIHPEQAIHCELAFEIKTPLARQTPDRLQDAYEKLLIDVIQNNQTFFVHWREIEASWRWIDSISQARKETELPMQSYAPGTSGPISSHLLPRQDGKYWYSNRATAS